MSDRIPASRKPASGADRPSSMPLCGQSISDDKPKSPKEARRNHKRQSPSSPTPTPRSLPVPPSLLRHHTTSQSEAMARDFFGQAQTRTVDQRAPFSKRGSLLQIAAGSHHSHQRHRQNMMTSPLLRRQNPNAQTATVHVVSPLNLSRENLDPETTTSAPPTFKPSIPNLQLPALSQPSLPPVLQQDAPASPGLLSPRSALQGLGAPNTAGVVSPGLRRKAQNPADAKPQTGESGKGGQLSPSSYFRVVVLGDEGVGKSTLVRQMAVKAVVDKVIGESKKENMRNGEEEEEDEKEEGVIIQIQTHDRRYMMEIFDSPLNANIDSLRPDAFIVMYSASDRKSYLTAQEVTRHLRCELGMDRTIFLVANKMDLRRQQHVPTKEAKSLAEEHDCCFVETSAALRLNTDRLVIKLLDQIIQQLLPPETSRSRHSRVSKQNSSGRALQFFSRLFRQALLKRTCSCSDVHWKNSFVPAAVADVQNCSANERI